jgi:hypothetical protein
MNFRNTAILGTVIASLLAGGIATSAYAQQAVAVGQSMDFRSKTAP